MSHHQSIASTAGPVPPIAAMAGAPGPVPVVTLDGVEIVQVVQDVNQSVLLVADKPTLVRVYLSAGAAPPVGIRGTLAIRRAGSGTWTQIPAVTSVIVSPANAGSAGLRAKREELALSLNFGLPTALLTAGNVEIELSALQTVNPTVLLPVPPGTSRQLTFVAAVPLRVHVIGVRYHSPGAPNVDFEPTALDYALTRSWLGRAYPVAAVAWSQTVVDWPGNPPWPAPGSPGPLDTWGRDHVNPFLFALRTQDIAAGTDHRTHYFGLAADGGGFMRGWATVPVGPDPGAVGSGPAGSADWGWDFDGSYADWYTGHELGHTFGRLHPGFCNGNSADDPAFPYPNGQIAHNNGDFVGYDAGEQAHAIAPRALPGVKWHDLMTYCEFQWLSAYTYEGIYHRLVAEDALPVPGGGPPNPNPAAAGGGAMSSQMTGIHVVARVNQTKGTAQFSFVTPVALAASAAPGQAQADGYLIRVKKSANDPGADFPAMFKSDACGDAAFTDVTGSIDMIVPNDPSVVALELVRWGTVLDAFVPDAEPPDPKDIRPSTPAAGGPSLAMALQPSSTRRPKIAWTPTPAAAAGFAPTIASKSPARSPLHTVQVSTDDGLTWRTIGVGLSSPEVSLDPQLLVGKGTVQVRVIATNGFRIKAATKTLSVKDL